MSDWKFGDVQRSKCEPHAWDGGKLSGDVTIAGHYLRQRDIALDIAEELANMLEEVVAENTQWYGSDGLKARIEAVVDHFHVAKERTEMSDVESEAPVTSTYIDAQHTGQTSRPLPGLTELETELTDQRKLLHDTIDHLRRQRDELRQQVVAHDTTAAFHRDTIDHLQRHRDDLQRQKVLQAGEIRRLRAERLHENDHQLALREDMERNLAYRDRECILANARVAELEAKLSALQHGKDKRARVEAARSNTIDRLCNAVTLGRAQVRDLERALANADVIVDRLNARAAELEAEKRIHRGFNIYT